MKFMYSKMIADWSIVEGIFLNNNESSAYVVKMSADLERYSRYL